MLKNLRREGRHTDPRPVNILFFFLFNLIAICLHQHCMKNYSKHIPYSPHGLGAVKSCMSCGSTERLVEDGERVCMGCGLVVKDFGSAVWIDATRVYITAPYAYNRRVHFREFFLSYQGKCVSPPYEILDKLHLDPMKRMPKLQFQAVLKMNVRGQMRADCIHALYYRFFDLSPPELLQWSQKAMNMCEKLFVLLARSKNSNTSIVSNQFLLYQILNNLGIATSWDDVLLTENTYLTSKAVCERGMEKMGWAMF